MVRVITLLTTATGTEQPIVSRPCENGVQDPKRRLWGTSVLPASNGGVHLACAGAAMAAFQAQ